MRTPGKADRIGQLFEWADRLPGRGDAEWRIRHAGAGGGKTALRDICKLSADGGETGDHLLGRIDEIGLFGAVPAASLIQRRCALPGVPLQSETEFVDNGRRYGRCPRRRV